MSSDVALTDDERRRYARHILLPEMGVAGQARLKAASVLMIGAGGLGASALSYLAAAGIGHLGIVDHDAVELSNLNRQIIHETGDIGRRKVESAADRLSEINPDIRVTPYAQRVESLDLPALLKEYDLVLDGSDNFSTRFVVAEACHRAGVTLVSAAVRGLSAQISTFKAYLGAPHPCYRCLVPELPHVENDCAVQGVLGPLVGVMGSMQALEAIKELAGFGESLSGRLLRYDARTGRWSEARLAKDSECILCGVNADLTQGANAL
jgi:adenylyltransferase/sulfurtransferase